MNNFQKKGKYIILSGAYNEASHIERNIQSVVKQTILPLEWVIIDDGSTDGTWKLLCKYAKMHSWIKVYHNEKENVEFGAHAVINFNKGLSHIKNDSYEFIVKLDTDLDIDDDDFFEIIIDRMSRDDKLGICSGITYSIINGTKVLTEGRPKWRTGGATKIYRRKCLEQMGGLVPIYGWDGIDDYKAMFFEWETRTFFDLHVNHLGKQRAAIREQKPWLSEAKGNSLYLRGYPFEFIFLKGIAYFLKSRKSGKAFFKGYFKAKINHLPQVVSKNEKKFIRGIQYKRLFKKI